METSNRNRGQIPDSISDARFLQLEDYREQTQKLCKKIHENIQLTCQNVMQVIEKDIAKH